MKTYSVTIKAVVIKTIEVEAPSKEEAEEVAHQLFNTDYDDINEHYNQETLEIK